MVRRLEIFIHYIIIFQPSNNLLSTFGHIRIFFVEKERAMKFEELKNLLVEDEINMQRSYCLELVYIHNSVESKVK